MARAGKPRPWWGFAGLAILASGVWVLLRDVEGWNVLWFVFAWVGWLLILDAAIHLLQGNSFVGERRRELGAMLFWSIPYWCVFEAYNLVLENWYYVFVPHGEATQALLAAIAFATVLPACFFHAEFLRALGWFESARWTPLRITRGVEAAVFAFGIAAAALPLLAPRRFFWIVWLATFGVPDVLARRFGAPSLLADLEQGRPGRLLRLLAGGLLAGFVWESANFWARAKWIYVVPGFESAKIFEMPFLGFLGFPLLAVQAFSGYSLLCHWARGGRHWERTVEGAPLRRVPVWRAAILIVAFSALTSILTLDPAVHSRRPLLSQLDGLESADLARLRAAGVPTPEWLCRRVESDGFEALASASLVPRNRLAAAYEHADLALHKGMGARAARDLRSAGISDVARLSAADPDDLAARLHRPRAAVRVWVRAARDGTRRR